MEKPAAVIFDGDGVLFDSKETHLKILAKQAEFFGERHVEFRGGDQQKALRLAGFSNQEVKKYQKIFDSIENLFGFSVFPGVNRSLERLRCRGIMTAAFSNRKFRLHNFQIFERSGLDLGYLDFFMLHDGNPVKSLWRYLTDSCARRYMKRYVATSYPKPDARAILPVKNRLRRFSGFPSSVVYVGDNVLDYEFAQNCGFGFIGTLCGAVEDPEVWAKAGVVNVVKDMSCIPDLIVDPA